MNMLKRNINFECDEILRDFAWKSHMWLFFFRLSVIWCLAFSQPTLSTFSFVFFSVGGIFFIVSLVLFSVNVDVCVCFFFRSMLQLNDAFQPLFFQYHVNYGTCSILSAVFSQSSLRFSGKTRLHGIRNHVCLMTDVLWQFRWMCLQHFAIERHNFEMIDFGRSLFDVLLCFYIL